MIRNPLIDGACEADPSRGQPAYVVLIFVVLKPVNPDNAKTQGSLAAQLYLFFFFFWGGGGGGGVGGFGFPYKPAIPKKRAPLLYYGHWATEEGSCNSQKLPAAKVLGHRLGLSEKMGQSMGVRCGDEGACAQNLNPKP